jgi:hypothetical protein
LGVSFFDTVLGLGPLFLGTFLGVDDFGFLEVEGLTGESII